LNRSDVSGHDGSLKRSKKRPVPERLVCGFCGAQLERQYRFCPNCLRTLYPSSFVVAESGERAPAPRRDWRDRLPALVLAIGLLLASLTAANAATVVFGPHATPPPAAAPASHPATPRAGASASHPAAHSDRSSRPPLKPTAAPASGDHAKGPKESPHKGNGGRDQGKGGRALPEASREGSP